MATVKLHNKRFDDIITIKTHYDNIVKNKNEIETLFTKNLRKINNFIKSCLLEEYVKPKDTILDFGCGKGGDLQKYKTLKITKYFGVDISTESIKEARKRAKTLNLKFITKFKVFDAYNNIICFDNNGNQFDIVISQFSFHYAFLDDLSLQTAVYNVGLNLKPGGYFIITVPKKRVIVDRIKKNKLKNNLYNITNIKPKTPNSVNDIHSYNFSLLGSVDKCVEYIVDFPKLKKLMEKEKIYLHYRCSFTSFFKEYSLLYKNLSIIMKVQPPTIDEMEVVGLYEVIIFKKAQAVGTFL